MPAVGPTARQVPRISQLADRLSREAEEDASLDCGEIGQALSIGRESLDPNREHVFL